MTPEEFAKKIVPKISVATNKCLCTSKGFRKLLSFNFENYRRLLPVTRIAPTALADAEILIQKLIREGFVRVGSPKSAQGGTRQEYRCPRCGIGCIEIYTEYSINMARSFVLFNDDVPLLSKGYFLVGFYGFEEKDFKRINDFERAKNVDEFIDWITAS